MSEELMVKAIQGALDARGVDDKILVAGHFNPRGRTGGMFAGGLIGDSAGGALGFGDAVGVGAGSLAGMREASRASGLPANMLVGVSATTIYGFAAHNRRDVPTELVFQVARDGLTVNVRQRVNVRVLELIHEQTRSRIQLEGNRVPLTHSKDVITALSH